MSTSIRFRPSLEALEQRQLVSTISILPLLLGAVGHVSVQTQSAVVFDYGPAGHQHNVNLGEEILNAVEPLVSQGAINSNGQPDPNDQCTDLELPNQTAT